MINAEIIDEWLMSMVRTPPLHFPACKHLLDEALEYCVRAMSAYS